MDLRAGVTEMNPLPLEAASGWGPPPPEAFYKWFTFSSSWEARPPLAMTENPYLALLF